MSEEPGEVSFLESSEWVDASSWEPHNPESQDNFFQKQGWSETREDVIEMRLHTTRVGVSRRGDRLRTLVLARELKDEPVQAAGFRYNSEKDHFTNNNGTEITFEDFDKVVRNLPDDYGVWYVLKPREENWHQTIAQDDLPPSRGPIQ